MVCRKRLWLLWLLATPLWGAQAPPYVVTPADGYPAATVDTRQQYGNKKRGSRDDEVVHQVAPLNGPKNLPPPQVVPYTRPVQAQEILIHPARPLPPLNAQNPVFDELPAATVTGY